VITSRRSPLGKVVSSVPALRGRECWDWCLLIRFCPNDVLTQQLKRTNLLHPVEGLIFGCLSDRMIIREKLRVFTGTHCVRGLVFLGCLFLAMPACWAQSVTVSGFMPQQAMQGSSVTLNIQGMGLNQFGPPTVQLVPGTGITVFNPPTTVTNTQITVQLQIAPNAPTISHGVQITFGTFAVTALNVFTVVGTAPPPPPAVAPVLTSVGPRLVTQGSENVRITLNGANFRPGARVIVSPPLPSATASTANSQATDVVVQSVVPLSSTLLLAEISVRRDAVPGVRAVDVVNTDGSSTGPPVPGIGGPGTPGSRTSQPLDITQSNSLAAPLQVATIAILYPRNGTVVSQGDDIYGNAILAGTGNGLITGEWFWDGNPFEQFAVPMTAGASVKLKTTRALPSLYNGPHLLTIRVTSPNQLQTRDVEVVVNPGTWKLEKLLAPSPNAGFPADSPPLLQWAPVPGADRYQVGFATAPFFNSVDRWYDVTGTEWQLPLRVWLELPQGELYWTVRAVEISGETRKPLPMRTMWRFAADVLQPSATLTDGAVTFAWRPMPENVIYRVSISQNPDGTNAKRRFLTRAPRLEVRSLSLPNSGSPYFWQVEVFSPDGYEVLASRPQTLPIPSGKQSSRKRSYAYQVASAGGVPPFPELASQIAARAPAPGTTVHNSSPTITVEFRAKVNAPDVALTVDETDVTSLAQITGTTLVLKPVVPFQNGEHQVTVNVGSDGDSWKFRVDAQSEAAGTGLSTTKSDAEVPPPPATSPLGSVQQQQPAATGGKPSGTAGPSKAARAKPELSSGQSLAQESSGQIASNTQWISGSTPDTNTVSITNRELYRNGPWTTELNGSGLLSSVLGPEPRHSRGRFNDYILRLGFDQNNWNGNLRFGVVAPLLYTNSEFVTPGSPREGVEASLGTPAGKLSFFANTNDNSLGVGNGIDFHQEIRGASYNAPLPKEIAELRFMWLSVRDTGAPTTISFTPTGLPVSGSPLPGSPLPTPTTPGFFSNASAGDAYGTLLLLKLGPSWTWTNEYSLTYNNPNLQAGLHRLFGRAWRSGISGVWNKTAVSVAFRDVSPNFGSPANPSLSQNSNPDRRGVDASISRPFVIGTFSLNYQFLQSGVHATVAPTLNLHNFIGSWSKSLTRSTVLQIGGREMRTTTGDLPAAVRLLTPDQQLALRADLRDAGANVSLSQHVGTVSLTVGGTRDWLRNRLITAQNVITTGVNAGANWQGASFFQINSNVSVNWINAEKFTVGDTRVITTYIQPMLMWRRTGLTVTPLISVSHSNNRLAMGILTSNNYTSQYVGRLSWQMPGAFKFSTLTLEGGQNHFRDAISHIGKTDPRVLLLWNMVWGYSRSSLSTAR